MKNLKEYIIEGIFDIEDNIDNIDQSIKDQIEQFLKDNFNGASSCRISNKPNTAGKYEVSSLRDINVKNRKITSFTNDMFVWTDIKGDFDCRLCDSLTSLKGAPEKVDGSFICNHCNSLTSLKGAPKEVGGGFYCYNCESLTFLEEAPEKVGGEFDCSYCKSLTSLKGAPKKVSDDFVCNDCKSLTSLKGAPKKVDGSFNCSKCNSLTSLEGAPKEVKGYFDCSECGVKFTKKDVENISNVQGKIYV